MAKDEKKEERKKKKVEDKEPKKTVEKESKNSEKSIDSVENEIVVEENKKAEAKADESKEQEPEIEKVQHKSVKPNIKKHVHGKKYRKIEGLVEKGKEYTLDEAIMLLKKTSISKFDGAVEIHINLNIDPANSDHQIRGSVVLPAGVGKEKKVAAVVSSDKEKEAKEAGAETVGGQNIIDKIEKGWLDFDVLVATPDMMGALGKIGRTLGTKGLMPNPKSGTVTQEIAKAIKEIKGGKVEYRIDKQGIIHAVIGRVSFEDQAIKDNFQTLLTAVHNAKPVGIKGTFIKSVHLTSTMGPGIRLSEK